MIPYRLRDSLRAILLAPLAIAPLVLAAFFLTSALGGLTRGPESERPELLLWCTSAVIASYLVTLLVGVPLVRRANASRAPLTARRGLQRGLATGLAISLGFIIVLMLPHAFTAFNVILFLVLGGLSGAVVGLLFAILLNAG